jgi:type I restriction-modification system DNA methylase subunit
MSAPAGVSGVVSMAMSPLGRKVPKPKHTGNVKIDARASFEHQAFVDAVNIMWFNADLRQDAINYLRRCLQEKNTKEQFGEAVVDHVSILGKFDDMWVAGYIRKELQICMDALGKAKAHDSSVIKHILTLLLNASPAASCQTNA